MQLRFSSLIFFLFLTPLITQAYPTFISHGYKSCLTCHYNSQGNGALNDYGRAVFASELASRSFYSDKTTGEELGESSGFLGKTQMPTWFRPGFKTRIMWLQTDPGSKAAKSRLIPMQAEASAAILMDPDEKWVLMGTVDYLPTPKALENSNIEKPSTVFSREHYLRWLPNENWILYFGLMDRAYGLRIADHKAFSREKTGNGMFDQTHGAMIQFNSKKWELTLHPFVGNLGQKSDLRQKGLSALLEYDIGEKYRLGTAIMSSTNDYMKWTRAEAHTKMGYGEGNAFLAEVGMIQDTPKNSAASTGLYAFVENTAYISRGYNLLSQIEYYNQTMTSSSPDQIRWSVGCLAFPAPRFEFRGMLVNSRTQADSGVSADQWQVQTQLHISL